MRTIERQIVSALIFSRDNKLLMGMKDPKDGGVYSDCWHIPGGGIDEGESKREALIREVKEEVGIDISKDSIELVDDVGRGEAKKKMKDTGEEVMVQMQFNVYKVILNNKSDEVKVVLNDDLAGYRWFRLPELNKIKLTPPSVTLFRTLGYLMTD